MLRIKKVLLKSLFKMLHSNRLALTPKLSRCRNKFLESIKIEYECFEKDRNELLYSYVTKDHEGNPVWLTVDGVIKEGYFDFNTLVPDVFAEHVNELKTLAEEEFIFEESENNKLIYDSLKIIFANLNIELVDELESMIYDNLCDQLEIELSI